MKIDNLPGGACWQKDRHGRIRYRFRKAGYKSAQVPGEPGSPEMLEAVAAILRDGKIEKPPVKSAKKPTLRSLDDLFIRYKRSPHNLKNSAEYQHISGKVIERFLDQKDRKGRRQGERPVNRVSVAWLDNQFAQMAETPAAANTLRKKMRVLLNHAIRLGWISSNPVSLTSKFREGQGHHDWTDAEIDQFRDTHPLGTMARLTLELALNTAARGCDLHRIEMSDIRQGRIFISHSKGSNSASVPILSTTRTAIRALPAAPIRTLIITAEGKGFSVKGLGNRMRKWCDTAGLPQCSMHGLRKSISRQMVERGATDAEGEAVTGHKSQKVFAHYRAAANRDRLADRALARIESKIAELTVSEDCRISSKYWFM